MLFRSNDTATTEIYTPRHTLSLHDALPISVGVCANGLPVLVTAGAVALTDALPWTDPEPEKVPVVAASATPPVAKTASDAARILPVRILEIGDLSIGPLREVATGMR